MKFGMQKYSTKDSRIEFTCFSFCVGLLFCRWHCLSVCLSVCLLQLVNFFANDCQRLFELMYLLPLCLGGPLLIIASTVYCVVYIGPWALIGAFVILLYYPYQVCLSVCLSYKKR